MTSASARKPCAGRNAFAVVQLKFAVSSRLLKGVNQRLAVLMVTLIVVSIPMSLVNELNHVAEILAEWKLRAGDNSRVIPRAQAQSLSGATWDQNWIQHGELLPAPTPDLFAQAGAIVATRAARAGATDADLATIIARSGTAACAPGKRGDRQHASGEGSVEVHRP